MLASISCWWQARLRLDSSAAANPARIPAAVAATTVAARAPQSPMMPPAVAGRLGQLQLQLPQLVAGRHCAASVLPRQVALTATQTVPRTAATTSSGTGTGAGTGAGAGAGAGTALRGSSRCALCGGWRRLRLL